MNQQQRSYAFERVSDLTKNKVAEIKKKFTTPAGRTDKALSASGIG